MSCSGFTPVLPFAWAWLWRFRSTPCPSPTEQRAARIAGGLLFALAAYVVLVSVLSLLGYREAQPSIVGIVLLVLAAGVMPWLASQKRKLAILTSSASLKADSVESALCGYLAWIALAGLAANAIWGKSWADPVAAMALTPLILREGWVAGHNPRQQNEKNQACQKSLLLLHYLYAIP